VVGPHDADLQEAGGVGADLGSGVTERRGKAFTGRLFDADVEDQQRDRDGQDAVAERFQPNRVAAVGVANPTS